MSDIRSEYFDPDGTPKLCPSICAYMDILGFDEISHDAYKQNKGNKLLSELHKIISLRAKDLRPDPKSKLVPSFDAKLFTDNVIAGQIITSYDGESEFGLIIMQVVLYQLQMAHIGFFTRGAITLGDLFIDENIVLGSALTEAYSIEQNIARDPRIVLSDAVFKLIKSHLKYYGEPYDSPQNTHVLIDSDGKPFVNYLSWLFEEYPPDSQEVWSYLKTHKQSIENNLIKYKKSPHIWSKHQWLASYHNFFCSECSDLPGYDQDLLIAENIANRRPRHMIRSRTQKPKSINRD